MSIIGFNFTKIEVEKKIAKKAEKVSIKNDMAITKVEDSGLNITTGDQKALRFEFSYETKFEPDYGVIKLEGNLISMRSTEHAESLLKEFSEKKKINPANVNAELNMILAKTSIQALMLSKEVNLPSPIQLPKIKIQ